MRPAGARGRGGAPTRVVVLGVVALLLAGCTSTGDGADPGAGQPSSESPAASDSPAESESPSTTPSATPSATPSSGSPSPAESGLPAYESSISRIDAALERRMRWSHRDGCPVALDDLRYLRMSHIDFKGNVRQGEMVVHADVAEDVVAVFRELYQQLFPIGRMVLVDEYEGDDDRSMSANNTSAYNCRRVAGTDRWSEHAYGKAIDINPVQNPYVKDGTISPIEGSRFADVDRSAGASTRFGVISDDDPAVRAFRRIGWVWGGTWNSSKDYQHFSASGR